MIYFIVALSGLVVGSGSVFLIQKGNNKPDPVIVIPSEDVAKEQIEVQKQLTNTDLVSVPCSKEYIEQNSDLLCRELFCRMQTRGIDSKTSGSECEEISNISNSIVIIKTCKDQKDFDECSRIFRERK